MDQLKMHVIAVDPESKNGKDLLSFAEYCRQHPDEELEAAWRRWLEI